MRVDYAKAMHARRQFLIADKPLTAFHRARRRQLTHKHFCYAIIAPTLRGGRSDPAGRNDAYPDLPHDMIIGRRSYQVNATCVRSKKCDGLAKKGTLDA